MHDNQLNLSGGLLWRTTRSGCSGYAC